MTTNERTAIQGVYNRISEMHKIEDKAFHNLQEMSKEKGLPIWCSADLNLIQLMKLGDEETTEKALYQYNLYMLAKGATEAYGDLGNALIDIKFWK